MATSDRVATGTAFGACETAKPEDLVLRRERRIVEFQVVARPRIASLTNGAPQLEDLADSFPGLLFSLATGYNSGSSLERAVQMTMQGAPLRLVADTLGLAWWLRRLPAGAFSEMLPMLPGESDFALRIGSFIPTDRRRAGAWLSGVSDAYLVGGREFALWTARAWGTLQAATPANRAGLVSAWLWYSLTPGTQGHELLKVGWNAQMSTGAAAEDLAVWLKRVALVEWLGTGTLVPWIPDAQVGTYEFRTLRRAEDFIAAAKELDNCLEQFAGRLSNGTSTVAKISRGGKTVACIEIGLHETDPSMPAIVQLRGHKNKRVSAELWRKAYDWLAHRPIDPFHAERLTPSAADRHAARQGLWSPYLAAMELHPDPAGRVAAQRLRRNLLPRVRNSTVSGRRAAAPDTPGATTTADLQPTMLQRVREHIATLAGFSHADHELMRWDAVERLEVALRGRRER